MRLLICLIAVALVATIVPAAQAATVPSSYHITAPSSLEYLDHGNYYKWGINTPWDTSRTPTSATLTLTNLADWTRESNVIHLDLLPTANLGVTSGSDNGSTSDWFVKNHVGTQLAEFSNWPATPKTLTYNFTSAQLATLKNYAADGRFGIGVDPDCHFTNCGVSLDVGFRPAVPVPAAALLAIPGFAAAAWARRRMRHAA